MKIKTLLFFLSILSSCHPQSRQSLPLVSYDRIDSLLQDHSRLHSNTGIAVAIVKDTNIIYNNCFGYSDLTTRDSVTSKTMFHLGSVPKAFVAVALMQLVEQNRVSLDSPVVNYIPELRFKDPRYKDITVRNLATHSSGIYSNRNHNWDKPENSDVALDNFVRSLDFEQLRFDPGASFNYSDLNYDILGDIIYRVTGIPFEDYMKEYVLGPCGMAESAFYLPDTSKVARPYIDDYQNCCISKGVLFPVNRERAPSGTLFSNTSEMCNWMIMNLHRGKLGSNVILEDKTYDILWNPFIETTWKSGLYESIGIGWFAGHFNGKKTYLHSGVDYGYRAIFCIIPEDQYGVVILSNYRETAIHFLLNSLLAEFYPAGQSDNSFDLISKTEYPDIAGDYVNDANETIVISTNGDYLYVQFYDLSCCLSSVREGNIMAGQLFENPIRPFYYDMADVFLSKVRDDDGNMEFIITLNGIVFRKEK